MNSTDAQANELKYREEYRQQPKLHAVLGVSEDQYVEQRFVEDGIERHSPDEIERRQQITALCEDVGLPAQARLFIDNRFSVTETRAALDSLAPQINGLIDDRYRAEYRQHATVHQRMGITEQEFIRQRRAEDGHLAGPR